MSVLEISRLFAYINGMKATQYATSVQTAQKKVLPEFYAQHTLRNREYNLNHPRVGGYEGAPGIIFDRLS